jgi:hypothetical protein
MAVQTIGITYSGAGLQGKRIAYTNRRLATIAYSVSQASSLSSPTPTTTTAVKDDMGPELASQARLARVGVFKNTELEPTSPYHPHPNKSHCPPLRCFTHRATSPAKPTPELPPHRLKAGLREPQTSGKRWGVKDPEFRDLLPSIRVLVAPPHHRSPPLTSS